MWKNFLCCITRFIRRKWISRWVAQHKTNEAYRRRRRTVCETETKLAHRNDEVYLVSRWVLLLSPHPHAANALEYFMFVSRSGPCGSRNCKVFIIIGIMVEF